MKGDFDQRTCALDTALLLLLPALYSANVSVAPAADARTQRVHAHLAYLRRGNSQGLALAIVRDGKVVLRRGYGLAPLEHNVAITSATVFDTARAPSALSLRTRHNAASAYQQKHWRRTNRQETTMSTVCRVMVLTLLAAVTAAAQPVQPGQVVLIKSNSGMYLSARPSQTLGLSANTGGWEQWQVAKTLHGLQLVSYHGTALLIGVENVAPFHAASGAESVHISSIATRSLPGGTSVWGVNTGDEPALNALVTLSYQNGSAWFLLQDVGGSLTTGNGGIEAIAPVGFWTLVPVPATSRQPGYKTLQPGVAPEELYRLRSAHQTWLTHNITEQHGRIDDNPRATHESHPLISTVEFFTGRKELLHFGQKVWLLFKYNQYIWFYVAPGSDGKAILSEAMKDQSAWTVVDATGVYRDADRVPLGAKVFLRSVSTGTHLSANPEQAPLLLSASKGGWEEWVIVK